MHGKFVRLIKIYNKLLISLLQRNMFKKIVIAVVVAFAASAENTQAVQIKSTTKTEAAVETQQKWGFLKNIVNIDRFFDSGVKA